MEETKVLSEAAVEAVRQVKDKLTPEEEKFQEEVCNEWIARSIGGSTETDDKVISEGFDWLYKISGVEPPKYGMEVYDSPQAAVRAAKKECADVTNTHYVGLMADAYWVAFYDFFTRIKTINEENFNKYRNLLWAGVWDCICLDEKAFVIRRPELVSQDTNQRLHAEKGPALRFRDGFEVYVWHGVLLNERMIMRPESYTRDELMLETNSEIRRAFCERVGFEKYAEIMGVVEIDSWTDPKTGLKYDLMDFASREGSLQPRLLKMVSPVIKTGERPYYIEPVDPGLETAAAARKWQFPKPGGYWTVEECNKNPEINFSIET